MQPVQRVFFPFSLCRVKHARHALLAAVCCCAILLPLPVWAAVGIVDDAGKTVTLAAPARRIIPLYAGLGETLAAMGLTDRIIARTVSDNTLPAALPVVGTHMRPNPELIAGLGPDLVVQLEGREEAGLAAEALTRMGIPVARFRTASFADLYSCIARLGVLTGAEQAAADLAASLAARLEAVRERIAARPERPAIFFEVRYPNLLGAGSGSMVNDVIHAAGGRNCLAGYPERMVRLSEEALVLADPDLYLVQQGAMNKAPVPLETRAHFRSLAALRTGSVHIVAESLYSRPGPQSVAAVEELADLILRWHASRTAFRNNTP